MANSNAIAAVGLSIQRHLNLCFAENEPVDPSRTRAVLVTTNDFEETRSRTAIGSPALSIYLYRVDFNKTMRAAWSAVGSVDGRGHLALDLHFLLTPWAENAEFEHRILGRTMECIEMTPILSGPLLHPSSNWTPNESIQLVLEEISTEAVMRTFDSLPTDYRLSVPYIARIVRIDTQRVAPEPPVTSVIGGAKASSAL